MLADWIRETTTGGSGALTTSAVTNYRRFTDAFAVGQPFLYAAVDPTTGTPIERGMAKMTAVGTMSRLYVMGYNSGGTFTDGNTAQNLPSGTRLICTALSEGGGVSSFPAFHPLATNKIKCPYPYILSANTAALGTNTPLAIAVRIDAMKPITAFGVEVTTAAGTGSDRLQVGVYAMNDDGSIGDLVMRSGDMLVNSTGQKTASTSGGSRLIPPGWYYMVLLCSINPTLRACITGNLSETSPLGHNNGGPNHSAISCTAVGSGWTVMPTNVTASSIQTINATFCPMPYLIY